MVIIYSSQRLAVANVMAVMPGCLARTYLPKRSRHAGTGKDRIDNKNCQKQENECTQRLHKVI